ncbi:MAG: molybdopterin dehydrogenase FAD-binding protein [Solirubrobacterales bacterium]|jgi:carbon-monoxide dehydrogenase medium subunit|nr:molybdopterin dehydrogenase FAD-binding protein [Solirubrobacterales bacterium]
MYPRPFEYVRAETVDEATEALASAGGEARAIAGGQSLVPMMSLGLASPDVLVDIGPLPLAGSERANGSLALGALTRHRELERSDELAEQVPLAAEAARYIGNPRVRNRGTLGGSLSHADPASELGAVALAYGGEVVIAGAEGERRVAIDDFFEGFFATAVGSGELLTRVELELPPPGTGHGFCEIANRADDFATAAAAVLVTVHDGGACAEARLALAGVADRPLRCEPAERLCRGETLEGEVLDAIARAVVETAEPEDDAFVSADYRGRAAAVCAIRALGDAARRAREGQE